MINSENILHYTVSNRLVVLFLFFVLWSVLLHGQDVIWEDENQSITVSGGEKKFTSYVAPSPEVVESMAHYNFAAPFSLDPNNEEGINAVLGQNGRVVVNMFSYDPSKDDGKGPLVYGIRSAEGQSESWPVVYTHSFFGDKSTSSTNIKRLSHNIEIFKTAEQDGCNFDVMFGSGNHHRMADIGLITAGSLIDIAAAGSIIATLLAAPVTGGTSLAAIDTEIAALVAGTALIDRGIYELGELNEIQEECQKAYTPYQPIILEITIRNATFHSLRLPGHESLSKEMTAWELFNNALETSPDQLVINNDDAYAVFQNDQGTVLDKVELTVNGDLLITDISEKIDATAPLLYSENWQLYVGSKQVGSSTDEDDIPKRTKGILAENFVIDNSLDLTLPDYVFEPEYKAKSIEELETYVKTHKHLPDVPSQKDVEKEGYYSLPSMLMGQLKNLEELYLHAFNQNDEIYKLKTNQQALNDRLLSLKETLENLKNKKNEN